MTLRATEMPIAAATPASPPTATEAAAAKTCDLIVAISIACTVTAPSVVPVAVPSVEFVTSALTCTSIRFNAAAPPPATAMPAEPDSPTATAAACELAMIVALSVASTPTEPAPDDTDGFAAIVNDGMPLICARTGSAITFSASAKPIAAERPTPPPPSDAAIEAASTSASITALSVAAILAAPTTIVGLPVPASTSASVITFSVLITVEAAPASATPVVPPPEIAAETAITSAEMRSLEFASTSSRPLAVTEAPLT